MPLYIEEYDSKCRHRCTQFENVHHRIGHIIALYRRSAIREDVRWMSGNLESWFGGYNNKRHHQSPCCVLSLEVIELPRNWLLVFQKGALIFTLYLFLSLSKKLPYVEMIESVFQQSCWTSIFMTKITRVCEGMGTGKRTDVLIVALHSNDHHSYLQSWVFTQQLRC